MSSAGYGGIPEGMTTGGAKLAFSPRTREPKKTDPYGSFYCKAPDGPNGGATPIHKSPYGCTALYNCVGYAWGRFNEINGSWAYSWGGNGGDLYDNAPSSMRKSDPKDPIPQVGALAIWTSSVYTAGHVAVVEQVDQNGDILISESTYSLDYHWRTKKRTKASNYSMGADYKFRGFVYHPKFPPNNSVAYTATNSTSELADEIKRNNTKMLAEIKARDLTKYRGMDLLSSATLVESPFIIAEIGDYTFGSYTKEGSLENAQSKMKVTYPNYMDSITIIKTNGELNTYTLNMIYQIVPGKDPNLIDKVLSSVSDTRKIVLSYGDWELPSFIYQKEEAIITKVTSNLDFNNSRITYQLECVSKAFQAAAQTQEFPVYNGKGSDRIKEILYDTRYGLLDVFPGMANEQKVADAGLIPGDDTNIKLEAKKNIDPLKYLNYIVASMTANSNIDTDTNAIKDSIYHLVIMDDIENEFGGAYFKIVKIGTSTHELTDTDIYEVDLGFPTNTLITDFSINTDDQWTILYNYKEKLNLNNYVYSIDNEGNIISDYVDSAGMSAYYNRTTETDKTWWTQATQFPVTATLSIKGLLRPAILMNYIRINSYFYGQRHISSGVYAITKQEDTINASGYKTVLSLVRVESDGDEKLGGYIETKEKDLTEYKPKEADTLPVDRNLPVLNKTKPDLETAVQQADLSNFRNITDMTEYMIQTGIAKSAIDNYKKQNNLANNSNGYGGLPAGMTTGKGK